MTTRADMATMKQAKAAADKVGATLLRNHLRQDTISLDLPCGSVLYRNGCHYYDWDLVAYDSLSQLLDDVVEALSEGVEPCNNPDCDICAENVADSK